MLDSWFFFLTSAQYINLSGNAIFNFSNNLNFNMNSKVAFPVARNQIQSLDLSSNKIQYFDDYILGLYSICDQYNMTLFLQFMYNTSLTNNPLFCDCSNAFSMNLLTSALLKANYPLSTSSSIFQAACQTSSNSDYVGKRVVNFFDPSSVTAGCSAIYTCPLNGQSFNRVSAPNTGAQLGSSQTNTNEFYDGYIAGIVIGFLALLLILLIILYCVCPIEIHALCLNCMPCFYQFCPCKRNHRRDKMHDLFISFNKMNEKWISSRLLPFIKSKFNFVY